MKHWPTDSKTYVIIQGLVGELVCVKGGFLLVDREADIRDGDGWYCHLNRMYGLARNYMAQYINNENHWKILAHSHLRRFMDSQIPTFKL
jgi:hypothetical protein